MFSATHFANVNMAQTLRHTLKRKFPHWGSVHGKNIRASFTIAMDSCYSYYSLSEVNEDPDELFEQTQGFFKEVQEMIANLSENQATSYDEYITESLTTLIYGSNFIERVGANHQITQKICQKIFAGVQVPLEIPENNEEYATARNFLISQNKESNYEAVIRSRREIAQHALALKYIVMRLVIYNEDLSEELILKTHGILCDHIRLEDGEDIPYAGIYRTVDVSAGFSAFTAPAAVPSSMRILVKGFNRDIAEAEKEGKLDPFALAAKYCHKFVNIHPFVDGNGRVCRLILNSILLKYAGIVVPLGETEQDREEYLAVAIRASEAEQIDEDERGNKPAWAELCSLVIRESASKFKTLRDKLKEKA